MTSDERSHQGTEGRRDNAQRYKDVRRGTHSARVPLGLLLSIAFAGPERPGYHIDETASGDSPCRSALGLDLNMAGASETIQDVSAF